MANKQETKKDKKEEITNETVSPKKESGEVIIKKSSSKKKNETENKAKTSQNMAKAKSTGANKKTKSAEIKNKKILEKNKTETTDKKTSKASVEKNSNGRKKNTIKNEKKDSEGKIEENKEKKAVKKEQEKLKNDEEDNLTEVKEEVVKLEEIKSTLNKKNKISKEKLEEIYGVVFKNIAIAAVVIIYFIFLNLGQMNIKPDIYQTDLKVFSITSLLISIVLFEKAYKKDSGEIAIYGIEMLILAIVTLSLIYINLMFSSRYVFIVNSISCIFAIYYLIKSVIVYIKKRKKCYIDDMKEIINKEEE